MHYVGVWRQKLLNGLGGNEMKWFSIPIQILKYKKNHANVGISAGQLPRLLGILMLINE